MVDITPLSTSSHSGLSNTDDITISLVISSYPKFLRCYSGSNEKRTFPTSNTMFLIMAN